MDGKLVEGLKEVFVTQEQFGDYKETIAKTVGDIKGSVRSMKWISGLIFISVAVDIVASLLHLK